MAVRYVRELRGKLWLLMGFGSLLLGLMADGCFTNFQTARTVEGTSITLGWQRFLQREGHWVDYYLLMSRFGRAARRGRFGYDVGMRAVLIYNPWKKGNPFGPTMLEDFKLQFPANRVVDFAVDAEFWGIFPMNLSILVSKDLWHRVSPYCEFEAKGILLNLQWEEDWTIYMPSLIYGLEVRLSKGSFIYLEGERWLGKGLKENYLFGIAYRHHLHRRRR